MPTNPYEPPQAAEEQPQQRPRRAVAVQSMLLGASQGGMVGAFIAFVLTRAETFDPDFAPPVSVAVLLAGAAIGAFLQLYWSQGESRW